MPENRNSSTGSLSPAYAISGLHVSIVGLGIWKIFRKGGAGFWISGIFAGGFLCAYGMMVGSGASVARAVSMAGLSFLAWYGMAL